MGQPRKLSIIIASYNYQDFVGAAIASALAVDWPDKEVIVVDDASTDGSRRVIEGFGSSVTAFFRPKSNQLGVHIFGFEQSTGDVVILLDADDLLEPEVMQEVAKQWRSGISKVQYRMALIDANGAPLGTAIPQFPPRNDPERLRRGYLRTMAYTTPPGSGNAYARGFVAKAYAIALPTMRWSDDVLLTLAPLLGDVLTIRKPLAHYRIHEVNYAAFGSLELVKFRRRLLQDVEKARLFVTVSRQLRLPVPCDPLRDSLDHLQYRLASYLLEPPAHPFPGDNMASLVYHLASSAMRSSQMAFRDRVILLAWTIACVLAPRHRRGNLVRWRFVPMSRPVVIRNLLNILSSLRSPPLRQRS